MGTGSCGCLISCGHRLLRLPGEVGRGRGYRGLRTPGTRRKQPAVASATQASLHRFDADFAGSWGFGFSNATPTSPGVILQNGYAARCAAYQQLRLRVYLRQSPTILEGGWHQIRSPGNAAKHEAWGAAASGLVRSTSPLTREPAEVWTEASRCAEEVRAGCGGWRSQPPGKAASYVQKGRCRDKELRPSETKGAKSGRPASGVAESNAARSAALTGLRASSIPSLRSVPFWGPEGLFEVNMRIDKSESS